MMRGRVFLPWAVASAIALLALGARTAHDAATARVAGDRARAAGDRDAAMRAYEQAARAYVPGATDGRAALDALIELGTGAANDPRFAARCLWSARGAIRATRWLLAPYSDAAPGVDAKLAALLAASPGPDAAPHPSSAHYAAMLRRDDVVPPAPALLVLLALAAWLTSTALFLRRGLGANLWPAGRAGWLLCLASLGSFCLWLHALR